MAISIRLKHCCLECSHSRLITLDRSEGRNYDGEMRADRLIRCDNEPICVLIANDTSEYLNA